MALAQAIDNVLLEEVALDQVSILRKVSSDKVAQQYLALAD